MKLSNLYFELDFAPNLLNTPYIELQMCYDIGCENPHDISEMPPAARHMAWQESYDWRWRLKDNG